MIGAWSMLGSATAAEVMASAGLDYVILDLEHGLFDPSDLMHCVRAVQCTGAAAIPRLPEYDSSRLLNVLETAPDGVLVAHVESAEVAKLVVEAALYPPLGTRGMSPYTRVHGFTHVDMHGSSARANEELMIGVLVEGPNAATMAREAAEIERLDLIYFGIFDFAQSVGFPGRTDAPEVQEALGEVAAACRSRGTVCGTFAKDRKEAERYLNLGLGFVAVGSDGLALQSVYQELLAGLTK